MSKAVAYLRFSTKEQMDEYNSNKMREFLKKTDNMKPSDSIHSTARMMLDKLPAELVK